MTACKIEIGDYILREDIPDESTLDEIFRECERQGCRQLLLGPSWIEMQNYDGVLLRGGAGASWLITRLASKSRRLRPADLGIHAKESE